MPTTAWLRRTAVLAAGMSAMLTLAPAPGRADPGGEPTGDFGALAEQLEIVVEQYNDLREEVRETQARLAALRAEMVPMERTIATYRAEVGQLAARAYRHGDVTSLNVLGALLTAGHRENLVDPLVMLDQLVRERHRTIARLTEAHARLAAARAAAQALAARQRAQERQLARRKLAIERELARLSGAPAPPDEPPTSATPAPPVAVTGAAATAVRFAYAQLGKRYRWGGEGPDGYDCSGLTAAAWAAAGVRLPHNAARQWRAVTRISESDRRPGDLVFYYRDIHHVAIYVGDGKMIHAPGTGRRVRIDRVDYQPVVGYGRPG